MPSLTGIPESLVTENKWSNFTITDSPEVDGKSFKTITFEVETEGLEWVARRTGAVALAILALLLLPLCFEGYRNLTSFLWNDKIAQPLTKIPTNAETNEQQQNEIVKEGMTLLTVAHERKLSDEATGLYKLYVQTQITAEHGNPPEQTAAADLKYAYWCHFQKASLPQEHLNLLNEAAEADYAPAQVSLASLLEQDHRINAIVWNAKAAQQVVTHDTPQPIQEAIAKGTLERDRLILQFTQTPNAQKDNDLAKALIEEKLEVGFTLLDQFVEEHNPYAMLLKGQCMLDHPPEGETPEEANNRTTKVIVSFGVALSHSVRGKKIVDPTLRAATLSHLQNLFKTSSMSDQYKVYSVVRNEDQDVAATFLKKLNKQVMELVNNLFAITPERRLAAIEVFNNHPRGLALMVAEQLVAKEEYDLASSTMLTIFSCPIIMDTVITETIQKLKECYSYITDLPLSIRIYNTLQVRNAEGIQEIEEQLMVKVLKDQHTKEYFVTTASDHVTPELQFAIAKKLEEQRDHKLAFQLYEKAADNHAEAVLELARCYKDGIGVEPHQYISDAYNTLYNNIRSPIAGQNPIPRLIAKRHTESWGALFSSLLALTS